MRSCRTVMDRESIGCINRSRIRINNASDIVISFNNFLVGPFLSFGKSRRSSPVILIDKRLRRCEIAIEKTSSFDISLRAENVPVLFLGVYFLCDRIGFDQRPNILDFYRLLNLCNRTPIIPQNPQSFKLRPNIACFGKRFVFSRFLTDQRSENRLVAAGVHLPL